MINQLWEYYCNAKAVHEFNDKAKNDSYWFRASMENDIETVRVATDPLEYTPNVEGINPPYFLVPQIFFGYFFGLSFRTISGMYVNLNQANFSLYSSYDFLQNYEEFSVDDPIVLAEGSMDAELCSQFYPYCMASLGSTPSKRVLYALAGITRKIIFIPDNDDTGQEHRWYLKNDVGGLDIDVDYRFVAPPDKLEDAGDFFRFDNYKNRTDYKTFKGLVLREIQT